MSMLTVRDQYSPRSVFGDDRAAEAVVDPGGDEIGVAVNTVGAESRAGRGGERGQAVADEQMVVFNGHRPARGKAVFNTDTHGATPAVVAGRRRDNRAAGEDVIAIGDDGRAALYIEQGGVPGITYLAGEQTERVH